MIDCCSSAQHLLNRKNSPGINPKVAANGNPTDPTAEGRSWKCADVLLSAWSAEFVISIKVLFALYSIGIHFTSNHPLYDKYVSATTNNPTTIAASLIG